MKLKTWLPIAIALVLGLFAAVLAKRATSKAAAPAAAVKIVVAKRAIAPGQALTVEDLDLRAIATDTPPEGAQTDPSFIVGRTAQAQLVKGQPVVESLLAAQGSASGLQALVPPGMRAMTIEVNEFSAVAGMITPGARVDVLSTMLDARNSETMSRTIAQNVLVKAVGKATGQVEEPGDAKPIRSVTLLVTSKQAEALQLSAVAGRPWLVLRGQSDDAIGSSGGTTLADLRGGATTSITRQFLGSLKRTNAVANPVTPNGPDPTTRPIAGTVPGRSVHTIRGTVENTVTVVPLHRDAPDAALRNEIFSNTPVEP